MKHFKVVKRYTIAFVDILSEDEYSVVEQTLKAVVTAFDHDVMHFLKSPLVEIEEKVSYLTLISEKLNLGDNIQNFLVYLAKKRRIGLIHQITEEVTLEINKRLNQTYVTVESKFEIGNDLVSEIKVQLEKKLGKKIELTTAINPHIVGGFLIKQGDKIFDFTLNNKLKRLKQALHSAKA
jgi:F-type H+-transporting ATPase subunit delta